MSDDDMIRCGDVLKAVYDAMVYSNRVPLTFVQKRIRALIDNPQEDTISTLYGALAQRQQPLGAEFGAAIFSDVESLYDDNTGKEVMPSDETRPVPRASDTAAAGLSAGGGANYDAVRMAIHQMVGLEGEYHVEQESADRALALLHRMEAKRGQAPLLLVEDGSPVFTWVIGGWKLYQYCDEEETQTFRWQGPPATEGRA
jgi:hypothetical protein